MTETVDDDVCIKMLDIGPLLSALTNFFLSRQSFDNFEIEKQKSRPRIRYIPPGFHVLIVINTEITLVSMAGNSYRKEKQ